MITELYPHVVDPVLNTSDFDSTENANEKENPSYAAELGKLAQVLAQQFAHD